MTAIGDQAMTGPRAYLVAAAAHGLPTEATFPERPISSSLWAALIAGARYERLLALLQRALADHQVPLDASQHHELRSEVVDAQHRVLLLEAHLLNVAALLEGEGIAYRVLKGPALARLDYERPSDRGYVDVDLLVPGTHFDEAVAVFTGAGFRRLYPEPRAGFDRRFSKGTTFLAPDGYEVDLHRTWRSGPYAHLVDIDDVWGRSATVDIAGRLLPVLAREDRVLHACFHAGIADDPPRLLPFRDLAEILRVPCIDVPAVWQRARAWQAEAVVARAVGHAWTTLRLDGPCALGEQAFDHQPSTAERRWVAAYTGDSYPVEMLASLRAIRGVREKAAYLRALAFPDSSYVADRYGSNLQRFAHAAGRIVRHRRSSR